MYIVFCATSSLDNKDVYLWIYWPV